MKDEKILYAAQMIMNFFPDEPCNYNGMCGHVLCDYCEEHCGEHDVFDCWVHAIENKWYLPREEEK